MVNGSHQANLSKKSRVVSQTNPYLTDHIKPKQKKNPELRQIKSSKLNLTDSSPGRIKEKATGKN
jgi:hypothetical protein